MIAKPWLYWGALAFSMALPLALAIHLYREFLDPINVAWLAREGDSFQHYIGWHFFRREAWSWPLGAFSTLASDVPTSIVYTDSIPLFAIPLKLFHAWLPDPFQYLGLVMLVNYALNGFFAGRLLLRLGLSPIIAPLCAFLMASLPAITMRGLGATGHEALTAHWVIFIAMEYSVLRNRLDMSSALAWLALLTISVLLHFYLFFMVGVLWVFSMVSTAIGEKLWRLRGEGGSQRIKKWLVAICGTPVIIVFVMWSVGYFELGGQSAGSDGYGYFTAEIFTFFNPAYTAWHSSGSPPSFSQFFSGWTPVYKGQYEGIAYLGAGLLFVMVVAVCLLFLKGGRLLSYICSNRLAWGFLTISSLGMFAFALAGEIGFLNGNIGLGYDALFGPLREYLRSSGRLVWPLMYLLVVFSFLVLSHSVRLSKLFFLLILALWVQKEDLSPWHENLRQAIQHRAEVAEREPLAYSVWGDESVQEAWKNHSHIVALPTQSYDVLRPYMWIAAGQDMSINVAYLARISHSLVEEVTQPYLEALEDGHLPKENVYLLSDEQHIETLCREGDWKCRTHESVTVAWAARDE